uniref:Uncharacterized protein n=1 Tax=viral metagenome TaxID=1070528 RepID=A0A6H2A427_9ZZZZ
MNNKCAECRNGEHEDYDNDIQLIYARDPETKKIIKRANLCGDHRQALKDDGYEVNKC